MKLFTSSKIAKYFVVFLAISFFYQPCFAVHSDCLERKTFIITGATGQLGGATARLLAKDYNLILTGRDVSKLKKLQEELKQMHSGDYLICDLNFVSASSRQNFNDYLKQLDVPIAGLVLIYPRPQFYGKELVQSESVWLEVFQQTFTGPMEALQVIVPYLSNPGKIVVIGGTSSVQLQLEYGLSCVIRRMWTTYAKVLSRQLSPQGISVNSLSPGVVLTDFHDSRIQKKATDNGLSYQEQMEQEVANIPMKRLAQPHEVAQTVQFLLSEQSDYINGVNLVLDGGLTVSY